MQSITYKKPIDDNRKEIRPAQLTLLILAVSFIAFGIWSSIATIEQTAKATGQVIATSRTQLIQSANDGVIQEILVQEGQEIKKYTPSEDQKTSGKRGKKVGVAYQLENGEIIEISDDVLCNYTVIKDSELKTHILYDKYT